MTDAILVLNAGSSSLKFSLYSFPAGAPVLEQRGQLEGLTTATRFNANAPDGALLAEQSFARALGHDEALTFLLGHLRNTLAYARQPQGGAPDGGKTPQASSGERATAAAGPPQGGGAPYGGKTPQPSSGEPAPTLTLRAVGHRVVHGGLHFVRPVRVDAGVVADLEKLVPLAPLHQPHNLAPIRTLLAQSPQLPQVACFDTAFHRAMPEVAQAFALPPAITDRGVVRYGFHGLSYEYIANVLPRLDPGAANGRTIVAHLGNGASMCALQGCKSVASTMGFTAVDGLVMGTRTGLLDPGVMLYLMDELRMDARAIERLIYLESGLLGVSGESSDMRTLLASGNPRAAFAIELFCYRIARELGSLAAALQGLDALVFTGGIGEHAAPIRERVVKAAAWLGVTLDPDANAKHGPRISAGGTVRAWVVPTNEELMIAQHTYALLGEST